MTGRHTLRAMLLAAAFASPAMLHAQATQTASNDTSVEALVVTAPHYVPDRNTSATKSNVSILKTPQSVTVITRDQISVLNWQSTQQAVRYTAGVDGENFGPDQRYDYVTVRGFYPVEYIDGLQAPIAPASSLNDIGVDLWGFDSIEILKGPASVLYGETPPGGLLNLTSRRPQDVFHGAIEGQYGSFDSWRVAGDITGPITNGLDARLTALWFDKGTQLDFERHRRFYVAPAVTWNINPDTKLTFLSFYQTDHDRGCCGGFLPESGTLLPNPNGVIPPSRNLGEPAYNVYTRDEAGVGYEFQHSFNSQWSLDQDFKYFYFKDNTKEIYGAGLEGDGPIEDRYNFEFPEKIREFALDTRLNGDFNLGPVENVVLLGVDYRNYTNFSQFGFNGSCCIFGGTTPPINAFNPVYGAPISNLALFTDLKEHQIQTGIYGQDIIKWGDFNLTTGVREDWLGDHQPGEVTHNSKFTYRVGLNYVTPQGIAPYISYATSFQPTPGADFAGTPFVPSTGDQIEGGVKFEPTFLPRGAHLLMTAAAFHIVQNGVLEPDPNPVHFFKSVQTGQVKVDGAEFEAVARLWERISINGSFTYLNSKVTEGTPVAEGGFLGNQLFETPHYKASLFGDYTQQTGFLAGLGAGVGVRYLSSSYGDAANQFLNPAVTLFDAIIHYDTHGFRIALNANNLADKVYVARCSSTVECFYGERRNLAVTLSKKW
jgi:iron complex outermembrane receptor protein